MENSSFPFRDFLKNHSLYKGLYYSLFSKPFCDRLVIALELRHQMDLHLSTESLQVSEKVKKLLETQKEGLSVSIEYILSQVEEGYAAQIYTAFNAFKKAHPDGQSILSPKELIDGLNVFLSSVLEQIQRNFPPTHEQANLFTVRPFLSYIYKIPSLGISLDVRRNQIIFSDPRLSRQDVFQLVELIVWLKKDSENFLRGDQREPLPNQGLGQTETSSLVDAYKEAIMGAYAMFLASTPEALEDIPEEFRNSIKQSLELKNCLALSWTIQTQSQNQ
jgi:hypothetical protein